MAKRRGRRGRGAGVAGSQVERQSIIPDAVLDRRAEATGMARNDKRLTTVDASSALGILLQRGILTMQHYDAGQMLARAYRRWASSALAKPRTAKVAGIFGPDDKPMRSELNFDVMTDDERKAVRDEWMKIKARWEGAKKAVPVDCWKMVDCVVIDNVIPSQLVVSSPSTEKSTAEILRGMNALCQFFNIAPPEAA